MNSTARLFRNAAVLGIGLTMASYAAAFLFRWTDTVNWLEAFAVATSYACTYLAVKQSRWNYPLGMVSTIAYCIFFWQIGLLSSAALNAYLPFALLYGWLRWGPDRSTRPVSRLKADRWLVGYGAMTAAIYVALIWITSAMGATLPLADAAILVLSILAQLLLDNKKIETWFVWMAVNIIAIWVYFNAGAPIAALQFVFFLGNAFYGLWEWRRSHLIHRFGLMGDELNRLDYEVINVRRGV